MASTQSVVNSIRFAAAVLGIAPRSTAPRSMYTLAACGNARSALVLGRTRRSLVSASDGGEYDDEGGHPEKRWGRLLRSLLVELKNMPTGRTMSHVHRGTQTSQAYDSEWGLQFGRLNLKYKQNQMFFQPHRSSERGFVRTAYGRTRPNGASVRTRPVRTAPDVFLRAVRPNGDSFGRQTAELVVRTELPFGR